MRLIISNLAREYLGFVKQTYWEILCFAKAFFLFLYRVWLQGSLNWGL